MESLNCRCVGATFLTAAQLRKWNASECEGTNHALPSRAGNPRHTRGWLGPKGAQGLGNMPALRLSALGSMSGGVCGAAAVLAQALLAAARGAARQRLGVSAEFSARTGLLATACALSAAKRLRGVVLPGLPLRLAPRLLFPLGSRHTFAQRRLDASVLASSRRDARRGGR